MLGALAWLGGRWIRRRWLALLPLLLVVAVGTAAAMIALGAADRTRTAYPDYLQRAEVGDVVLNPSLSTNEIDEVIRNLPGVEAVTSSSLFSVTDDDGQPRTRQEVESSGSGFTFVIGSSDGRFLEMDRPAVQAGRMPTGASEAAITVDAAKAMGLKVGDVMPLSFWQTGLADGLAGEELATYEAEEIEPIGVEKVEIVGILTLPDEVLPDELYPRAKVIVSPDIAQRYECLPSPPPPGRTFREFVDALLPSDCAASYRYYSLAFTDGAAGVTPALDAFLRTSVELNARLADISDLSAVEGAEPPQYFLIPTETAQEARRVDRAVRPAVTALWMLGGAVALVTAGLAALLAAREVRRSRPVLRQWHQLGLVTSSRAVLVGAPIAAAAVVGLARRRRRGTTARPRAGGAGAGHRAERRAAVHGHRPRCHCGAGADRAARDRWTGLARGSPFQRTGRADVPTSFGPRVGRAGRHRPWPATASELRTASERRCLRCWDAPCSRPASWRRRSSEPASRRCWRPPGRTAGRGTWPW